MKKLTFLLLAIGFAIAMGHFLTSCTKEGPAGKDQNATCTQCHTFDDAIVAKIFQYDASQHATGSTLTEASRNACAPCHSSQGFEECLETGADTTATGITDAAPINCRTCHQIHKTYTASDWALMTTAPYTLKIDHSITVDLEGGDGVLKGSSNLCGRCHQARPASPPVPDPTDNVDSIRITSSRWGPHHGPQSLILAAVGAMEMGSSPFGTSPHKNIAACMTCHGGNAQSDVVGGHSLWMTSSETGDNVAVCEGSNCHTNNPTSFDINGKQTEITNMFNQLKVQLATANMLDTNSMLLKVPKYYKMKQLAVFWNFQMVYADRSMGVHNYQYEHDMLQAGIDYLNAKGL